MTWKLDAKVLVVDFLGGGFLRFQRGRGGRGGVGCLIIVWFWFSVEERRDHSLLVFLPHGG